MWYFNRLIVWTAIIMLAGAVLIMAGRSPDDYKRKELVNNMLFAEAPDSLIGVIAGLPILEPTGGQADEEFVLISHGGRMAVRININTCILDTLFDFTGVKK